MFGTLTNYLLLDTPLAASNAQQATQQVYTALAGGHSYFANRLDGEADAALFYATRDDQRWNIGDSPTVAAGPLTLVADVGRRALVQLIYNGRILARGKRTLCQQVNAPGIYRLEAYHGGRPWLYTNPIFIH